jgi:hypothetical protein
MNTTTTDDFFRSRLDQMIELRHPLAVLASRMPWQEIEASIAQCFARQVRQGKKIEDVDLFGGVSALVGGGVSNAGRPRLPLRLPPSHNSCRPNRTKNQGAAKKERSWHDTDKHSRAGRLLGCCRLKARQWS